MLHFIYRYLFITILSPVLFFWPHCQVIMSKLIFTSCPCSLTQRVRNLFTLEKDVTYDLKFKGFKMFFLPGQCGMGFCYQVVYCMLWKLFLKSATKHGNVLVCNKPVISLSLRRFL